MTHLLEIFLGYFDFLYLDPQYRITDSSTSGSPTINAQLVLTGQPLSWSITNDRGHILVAAAPTRTVPLRIGSASRLSAVTSTALRHQVLSMPRLRTGSERTLFASKEFSRTKRRRSSHVRRSFRSRTLSPTRYSARLQATSKDDCRPLTVLWKFPTGTPRNQSAPHRSRPWCSR